MTYRRIYLAEDENDIRKRYIKCESCKLTHNCENLYAGICRRCHYPYISLAEFIINNPNNKIIN